MGLKLFQPWRRKRRLSCRLGRHLPAAGIGASKLLLKFDDRPWSFVEVRRNEHCLTLFLGKEALTGINNFRIEYLYRAPVIVHLLSRTSAAVTNINVNLDDGYEVAPNQLAFSSKEPQALLITDPDFFMQNGYEALRRKLHEQRTWHERDDVIVWRGSTTGAGQMLDESLDGTAMNLRPRIRLCGLLKGVKGTDVGIYAVVHSGQPTIDEERLKRAGLMGGHIARETWLDRKFAIDIDGNTNAWSNLFTRLLLGCCVLKVASPAGFRQWYYDRLVPWANYVPVRADLADLVEKIEWCRSHPRECSDIAAAGQALALSMTFEGELQQSIAHINRRLS